MKLKKTIYLVRHGMTAYNEDDLLQGRIDLPLSDRGKKEAKLLSETLKHENIDVIFHSPLKRAKQTAEIVNQYHNLELKEIACFTEIDMGDWEGQYYFDLIKKNKEFHRTWFTDPEVSIPGGESFCQVYARVKPGVAEVLACENSSILIAGHAAANRGILGALLNMKPQPARLFRMKNGAYSKLLVYKNGENFRTVVDSWNNSTHLEALA
ncbi:MAG: histidine phosphatase family protein [Candidatus Aminicenantes bacterium]|nr:histidine phosphatase family protein [Candidatus Aminicenantes bacterium]